MIDRSSRFTPTTPIRKIQASGARPYRLERYLRDLAVSLSGTFNAPADRPSYANNGSKLFQNGVSSKNPRNSLGLPYFNPNFFTTEPLGQIGNVMPRFFHGPGTNNTNLALLKNTRIAGSTQLQIRAEAFNVFNHTQFGGADGEIGDDFAGGFGYTTSANDPRIMQVALKLLF